MDLVLCRINKAVRTKSGNGFVVLIVFRFSNRRTGVPAAVFNPLTDPNMEELYGDEQILLQEAAAGAREAFNRLYRVYTGDVYHYIYLFTKSREETEEIVQEVFVHIWEHRDQLSAVRSFKPYVFRSARNRLINRVRHARIKDRALSEMRLQHTEQQESVEYELAYNEYHRLIQEAIAKLPPKRKRIFKMNIEEGASYDEIARDLDISKFVVKKQFYQASSFVRQYLYEKGEFLSFSLIYWLALFSFGCPFF